MDTTLTHHGILGQKWGVRRYQNKDGSLTAAGKQHLGHGKERDKNIEEARNRVAEHQKQSKEVNDLLTKMDEAYYNSREKHQTWEQDDPRLYQTKEYKEAQKAYEDACELLRRNSDQYMQDLKTSELKTGKERSQEIISRAGGIAATLGAAVIISEVMKILRPQHSYRQYGEWEGEKRGQIRRL